MAETSQQSNKPSDSNSNSNSLLAQQPRNDFAELESSLPPLPDIGRSLPSQGPPDLDQGVSPSNVNPLAASLALASNMPTPVPAPIERFGMNRPPLAASAWNLFPFGQRTPASPPLVPIPSKVRQENTAVPMEGVVSTRQFDLAKAMLDHQWALFVVAQEARDFNLMRMALNQAIPSQDLLTNLVGREEMLRISKDWVARDELAHLDRSTSNSSGNLTQAQAPNLVGPPVIPTDSHPTANPNTAPPHQPVRRANHTNRNQRELRPTPEIQFLGRTHSVTRERLPPPPPPPISHQAYQDQSVALRPVMAPQIYANPPPQHHYGYQDHQLQYHQPYAHHPQQNHYPHPYAPHRHQGGGNRGPGRRQEDPTMRMVRMGESFNRVERILARTSRIRGRERRQRNQSNPQYQNQEHFFNNLNSQFVPDTTFLIEDRLKDLFQEFLSKLSSTIHSFPNSVFHSCLTEFKSTLHKSVNEMIMSEIVPTLISEVLNHLKNDMNKVTSSVNIKDEIEPLKEFVKEHIETVQDILHVNDSQMQANIEQVRHDLKQLTQKQESQYTSLVEHLSSITEHENHRFDQIKRRLGDVGQTMNNLQTKINSHVVQELREPPPHLKYNNPFLNQPNIPPPVQQMETPVAVKSYQTTPAVEPTSAVIIEKKQAEWELLYPFIEHNIDKEVRKEIWKAVPRTTEWEKFNGELPYNHKLWLQNIDVFVRDYYLLDYMIISRLTTILTDTAKNWYSGMRSQHEDKSWAWWKNAIRNKFGTDNWKWTIQQAFEGDFFSLDNKKIHKWFNTQRERLRAYQPDLSEFLVCEKILKRCPGTLDHAVKCRYNKDPIHMNFEEMVIIVEAVLTGTARRNNNTPNHHQPFNRHSSAPSYPPKKNESPQQENEAKKAPTDPAQKGKGPSCFFCRLPGHLSKDCPKKRNRINNIDGDPNNNVAANEDENDNYDYDQPLGSEDGNVNHQQDSALVLAMHQHDLDDPLVNLGSFAIECELSPDISIAEIQATCHQPQTWSTDCQTSHVEDARLMRCKPDKGKAHLLGTQNLTNVLIEGKEYTCLLDSGASCSIISQKLLQTILPSWKEQLMPILQAKFHSCSDQLLPLGVIDLPLIFPHTKGSVRVQTEFVVMQNARMNYIIVGNDYLSLYGFDINNSKDRYFTIGNENKKKKFSFKSHHSEIMTPSTEISALHKQQNPLQEFVKKDLSEANINEQLTISQKDTLFSLLFRNQLAFATTDHPLGAIKGHEVHIKLTTERPYPPLLRRPPYPASPKSREALEEHIEELVRLDVLRKVGHNEVVEITTPVIIAWHNGKSRMQRQST
ncbi:hypothetical protein Pst134EB_028644 [Puccinia striiformis f. sp. tritici]|nr:hypothetical protein Pst134EB_028644 [Puccinia striiformis f. sp. tritici]